MMNILNFICKRNEYGYVTFFNTFSLSRSDFYLSKGDLKTVALWVIIPVPTMSMMPTIDEGDIVYVNKLAFLFSSPKRGDIITFDKQTYLVKRIVGIPGDKLSVKAGLVYINGERLPVVKTRSPKLEHGGFGSLTARAEPIPVIETNLDGLSYQIFFSAQAKGDKGSETYIENYATIHYLTEYEEVTIPDGKYFVLGDNRMFSSDSRKFGFVDESEIVGRVSTVIINLNAFKEMVKAILTNEPTDNLFLFKNISAS